MKSGGRQESVLSSFPLTDTAVREEMIKADERCKTLAKEIEDLKVEILALTDVTFRKLELLNLDF